MGAQWRHGVGEGITNNGEVRPSQCHADMIFRSDQERKNKRPFAKRLLLTSKNNNNYKDANMLKSTEERYRKLARNFYKTRMQAHNSQQARYAKH